jgi:hypothetical protein
MEVGGVSQSANDERTLPAAITANDAATQPDSCPDSLLVGERELEWLTNS